MTAARSNLRGGIRAQAHMVQLQTVPGYPPIRGLGISGRQTDLGPDAPAAPPGAPGSKHGRIHDSRQAAAGAVTSVAVSLPKQLHLQVRASSSNLAFDL